MSAFVYRYIDLCDGVVKYIGIVYSEDRSLDDRVREHARNDNWCKTRKWKIQYIVVNNRSEAETYETHFISLYNTGNYFNKAKTDRGVVSFIPEVEWHDYNVDSNEENEKLKSIIKHLTKENKELNLKIKYLENEICNFVSSVKKEVDKNTELEIKNKKLEDELINYKNTDDYNNLKEAIARNVIAERCREGKIKARENNPNFKEGRPKKYSDDELDDAMKYLERFSYNKVASMTGISKSTLIRYKRNRLL